MYETECKQKMNEKEVNTVNHDISAFPVIVKIEQLNHLQTNKNFSMVNAQNSSVISQRNADKLHMPRLRTFLSRRCILKCSVRQTLKAMKVKLQEYEY